MKPLVGISACLAGQKVRYNASSVKHDWIETILARYVELVPRCPEMEMGLGTPRNAMRLVRTEGKVQLCETNSGKDLTESAREASQRIITALPQLDAYILTAKSPTCGIERIKVYSEGVPFNDGIGVFAEALAAARPDLLIIDSGRLHNNELRDFFLKSLFTLARFNRIKPERAALQEFHRRHKFSLLAHHPDNVRTLGRIAASSDTSIEKQIAQYKTSLVSTLKIQPTRGRIINALEHMYGFLKGTPEGQRVFFFDTLEKYRRGQVAAIVPLKLLEMIHAGQPNDYLKEQFAWQPADEMDITHMI